MKTITLIVVLLLSGCASTVSPTGGPEVIEGNANSVIVSWFRSNTFDRGALGVADAHCANYGKSAQFMSKPSEYQIAYNCVK